MRLVVLTAMFLVATGINGESDHRDGNWWLSMPSAAKPSYIVGFLDGMELGYVFSLQNPDVRQKFECVSAVMHSYNQGTLKYFDNVTAAQLVDGLNAFYNDYKNRRIRIPQAMQAVVNGIAGMSEQDLKTMIENFRKHETN